MNKLLLIFMATIFTALSLAGALPFSLANQNIAQAAPFNVQPMTVRGGHVQNAVQSSQLRYKDTLESSSRQSGQTVLMAQAPDNLNIPNSASVEWRIRIVDAAVAPDATVRLGDIAVPAGNIPANIWKEYAALELWPAPPEEGKPMNITRPRLQQAVVDSLGKDFAALCLYPQSLIIQRGGVVLRPEDIQKIVQDTLAPGINALPGEKSLTDFRLPGYIFLAHRGQKLELENTGKVSPGRQSIRLAVKEVDGTIIRRLSGTAFLDCWAALPCAAFPLNKGDVLTPESITFVRKNLAYISGEPWDGKGGPWRVTRNITLEEPVLITDLTYVPTVRKGSIVTLIYHSGSVRLAVKAEALADGVKGETIPVRNVNSRKEVYATVNDSNSVIIDKRQ